MQAVSLHDDVSVELTESEDGIVVTGDSAALPRGADNIAWRAAEAALGQWGGAAQAGVRIHIEKRIPMAAGLAGGSADAAAVLLALAPAHVPLADVLRVGAGVGADVPFCACAIAASDPALGYADDPLASTAARCEGIGDILTPEHGGHGFAVLVKPAIDVPTPTVYSAWDEGGWPSAENDLEAPAIRLFPEIGTALEDVRALARDTGGGDGPERVFMTGSGPTIVALYNEENRARAGYEKLAAAYENRTDIGAVILTGLL
jgi:4-diphosphocytidyl-2-C-methyl-D-erythritol kinase